MLWQHVCATAVWSFISTKWQINQGAAAVGLCSLSVWTINLRLHPPLFLSPSPVSSDRGVVGGEWIQRNKYFFEKSIQNVQIIITFWVCLQKWKSNKSYVKQCIKERLCSSNTSYRSWSWTLPNVVSLLSLSPVIGIDTGRWLPCLDGDGTGWCVMPTDGITSCVNSKEMPSIFTW